MMNGIPLEVIGQKMGKNHSTVIYSRDKIAEMMKTDSKLATRVNDIKKMLLKQ
jgi:chromosomal replication initiation ATPase DnaA